MTPLRQRMHDMQICNLSDNAKKAYLIRVSSFARHFRRSPELLGSEEIRVWLGYLREQRKLAPASPGATIGTLRFLYRVTLERDWSDEEFVAAEEAIQTASRPEPGGDHHFLRLHSQPEAPGHSEPPHQDVREGHVDP
ncbi:integrase-like protein [Paraburkholderia sp. GV068]|uniref:phage integrase N-terminal SAM-like domain-containing protein n=1 Tax=Paraburkholderia TaxID=1822464 RepID=UPI000D4AAA42|nr:MULTISPECIES: phage integrase N-terminal SAM-like domain-containing protein [unclassified Paraburkholderia]PTQ92108.1 integrase-like protein [Paraburkholderia sp. GV072]PUA94318.1 integrase-like protein [Paraburkholderia sp. GV068]